VGVVLGAVLLTSCSDAPSAQSVGKFDGITFVGSVTKSGSCVQDGAANDLIAVTRTGHVVRIDPSTLTSHLVAKGVLASGGLAQRAGQGQLYVTARSSSGISSIWEIPDATCGNQARLVASRAELPSVSPDGGYLGYVTLDGSGRQTGVAIAKLRGDGAPVGTVQLLAAASVPPPLPIRGIAIGVEERSLAVWGGFVDSYLGRRQLTVGILVPRDAQSLNSLSPVFDAQGISIAGGGGGPFQKPEAWQSAPSYLGNGEFLVWSTGNEIVMPYRDSNPEVSGGGIRNIEQVPGLVTSLAAGPNGSLAWVGPGGHLGVSVGAINLPFGPSASTPPATSAPAARIVTGIYTDVTWSTGSSTQSMPPPVFTTITSLPSVVGLAESKAEQVMAGLALPTLIANTRVDPNVPSGTVLAQDPAAGTGVACQCTVSLTVSSTS